jgi:hypothetical protein
MLRSALRFILLAALAGSAQAEPPYFVTYSQAMEEPRTLEFALNQVMGAPPGGNSFASSTLELEYGVKAWWTVELYLSGQATRNESRIFTGYSIENRFRPLWREHNINPVLYFEYTDANGADRSLREIAGHDTHEDHSEPNDVARLERKHEIEAKLILSSNVRGWNISENIIAEKNLSNSPWEFGYAVGVSRPLAMAARPEACVVCPENFYLGLELYGGLGDAHSFGLRDTSHYLGPIVSWRLPNNTTIACSPGFGLNDHSTGVLWRFSIAQEFNQFGRLFR